MLISGKPGPCRGSHCCRGVQLPHHTLEILLLLPWGQAMREAGPHGRDAPAAQSCSCSSFPHPYTRLPKWARLKKPVCLSGGRLPVFIQESLELSLPKQQATPAVHESAFLSEEESGDFAPWCIHSVSHRDEGSRSIFIHMLVSSAATCCK